MHVVFYMLNQEPTDFNEMKVLTGAGLKDRSKRRSKQRSFYDKETI